MYLKYFGFKEEPFGLTPNPDFLYLTESHREALARMQLGIKMHKGFIVVTGEVGTGKTTLVRTFLQTLPVNVLPSLIVNPRISSKMLLRNICKDFGISTDFHNLSKGDLLNLLWEHIYKWTYLANSWSSMTRDFIVIIDEAHDLEVNMLEEVRLLTNLETDTRKLLQVILVGQPSLWDLLNLPELKAVRQRIQLHHELTPLTVEETRKYLLHRLKKAGYSGAALFSPEAIEKIYAYSRGLPRVINILCSNAFLLAFTEDQKTINEQIVDQVWKDFSEIKSSNYYRRNGTQPSLNPTQINSNQRYNAFSNRKLLKADHYCDHFFSVLVDDSNDSDEKNDGLLKKVHQWAMSTKR